jgi:hypothetical protein
MKCGEAKELFSPYLDGALTGRQMQTLTGHVERCPKCASEYQQLRLTQQLLAGIGRNRAPADLALRLKVAVSQEIAAAKRPLFQGVRVRFENAVNAFMVPATAGLASAVVAFGMLMSIFALPGQLQAGSTDVPLLLHTGPVLLQSSFGSDMNSINSDSLVIEAYVDANGRVQDYRILSDSTEATQEMLPAVKNMLIFTTFRPATSMGRPTTGHAVLSFSKVSVRG